MSLYISSLNSGSNGNCYYVGNQHEAVLIDAGLSCRETETRISRLGLSMNKIKAIFISHEHSDHTRGTGVISRKYRIPVYFSPATYANSRLHLDTSLVRYFNSNEPTSIGDLSVNAFPKLHDASEPHSFTVTGNGITIGVLTDIGSVCDDVIRNFSQCHAAFLEANYDEEMLESGSYPVYLKKRIRSDLGHLSNIQSLELFTRHKPVFMSHLLLSHLSQDNNDPRIVHDLFTKQAGDTHIAIASRHQESVVYFINGEKAGNRVKFSVDPVLKSRQMSLF
ncbi:MAG: MBL fold metallo-hydrolase [Lentimicrobiaceae bacterium]|jgi:phosphoribosyl 1,2-cyclic phosphodiesterase